MWTASSPRSAAAATAGTDVIDIDLEKPLRQWRRGEYAMQAGIVLFVLGLFASPSIAYALGWKWLWDATIWMLVIVLGVVPAVMVLIGTVRLLLWLLLTEWE